MSLAAALKQSLGKPADSKPAPQVTFAQVRKAMRADDIPDDEAEAALLAYLDRYMGDDDED